MTVGLSRYTTELELLWKRDWFANTEFIKNKSQQRESQFVASLILLFIKFSLKKKKKKFIIM